MKTTPYHTPRVVSRGGSTAKNFQHGHGEGRSGHPGGRNIPQTPQATQASDPAIEDLSAPGPNRQTVPVRSMSAGERSSAETGTA